MAVNPFTAGEVLDASRLNELVTDINTLNTDMTKARRGARQTVQNHVSAAYTYGQGAEMSVLTTSIVTEEANSNILYSLNISGEIHWDTVIVLQRKINSGGWVTIGSGNGNGSNYTGFMHHTYDQNNDSTPQNNTKSYLDSPNAPAGSTITYRIYSTGNGSTYYLNRAISSSTGGNYERCSSSVQLTEMVV